MRNELFREVVGFVAIVLAASFAAVVMMAASSCLVGGREQGPSEVLTETARAYSDPALVPAPGDRTGDVAVTPVEGAKVDGIPRLTPQPESASTVTQTALTAVATPVATSRAVETLAPKSINSYDPWPAYLWPVVECLIQRESGGVEWKVSPGGDVGLMQIGPANFVWLAERGITRAMLFDGPTNIRAGWLLYVWWEDVNGDGLTPWKSTRGGCA